VTVSFTSALEVRRDIFGVFTFRANGNLNKLFFFLEVLGVSLSLRCAGDVADGSPSSASERSCDNARDTSDVLKASSLIVNDATDPVRDPSLDNDPSDQEGDEVVGTEVNEVILDKTNFSKLTDFFNLLPDGLGGAEEKSLRISK